MSSKEYVEIPLNQAQALLKHSMQGRAPLVVPKIIRNGKVAVPEKVHKIGTGTVAGLKTSNDGFVLMKFPKGVKPPQFSPYVTLSHAEALALRNGPRYIEPIPQFIIDADMEPLGLFAKMTKKVKSFFVL